MGNIEFLTGSSPIVFQLGSASLVCPTKLAHVSDRSVGVDLKTTTVTAHPLRHADGRIEPTVGAALKAVEPNDTALLQGTLLHVPVDPVAIPVGIRRHNLLQFMHVVT